MSPEPLFRGRLLGLAAIALLVAPAAAQITAWPNRLSMWYERPEEGKEKVHLRVGPVAAGAELTFLLLPETATDVTSYEQVLTEGATVLHQDHADAEGWFDVRFIRKEVPRDAECGVYSKADAEVTFEGAFVANPRLFEAPPRPELPSPNIEARPGRIVLLNGEGPADDVTVRTDRPLVAAIKRAAPDAVIGVYGDLSISGGSALWIGGAQDPFKGHHVHWGEKPMRFSVVGMTKDAKITGFSISRDVHSTGEPTAGIEDVLFANLTIEGTRHGLSVISGHGGKTFGRLRIYDCRFKAHPEALAARSLGGFGAKWWIRVPTPGSYDIRNCVFDPVQEHCIYVDSPQGDNYFVGLEHNGSWRTMIQIVNRAWELPNPPQSTPREEKEAWFQKLLRQYERGEKKPSPSGQGRLLFQDIELRKLWGQGGAAITVAGFLGDVHLRDITAKDAGSFHGVFTAWTDAGISHGVHAYTGADGDLYSTRSVTIRGIDVNLPEADRDHVVISGVEQVHIFDFDIVGNRTALGLDSNFGTPNMRGRLAVVDGVVKRLPDKDPIMLDNGHVELYVPRPVSGHEGFRSAGKIRIWTNVLEDAQIDERWP